MHNQGRGRSWRRRDEGRATRTEADDDSNRNGRRREGKRTRRKLGENTKRNVRKSTKNKGNLSEIEQVMEGGR